MMSNDKIREAFEALIRRVEKLAFEAKAPNTVTPRLMEACVAARSALTQQPEPAGLDKLDPRVGDGEKIAHDLYDAYRKAFDKFAGPPEFRHACNYDDYHKAGLLGVYVRCKSGSPQPSAQVPEGWSIQIDKINDRSGYVKISGPGVYHMEMLAEYSLLDFFEAIAAPSLEKREESAQVPEGWREAAQEFVDWVECGGEHRKNTYRKFKELLAAPSIAEKREISHYVVVNADDELEFYVAVKDPISESHAKSMMHEHINDAINGGVEGAENWVVRTIYGLQRPEPPEVQS